MGQAVPVVAALSKCKCQCCSDMSKYVLNAARCSSKCCGGELTCQTDEIDVASDGSEESLEVQDCLKYHRK